LARFSEELHEDFNFCSQDFRDYRNGNVVHGAHFIAAQTVHVRQQDRGDENQGSLLKAGMVADHRRQLKAVDIRHVDVDENDGDVMPKQKLERFGGVAGAQQIFTNILEDCPIGQKLGRLIVDEEYVDLVIRHNVPRVQRWSQLRSADSSCSVFTGFAR
jgi:hypothetical protein